MGNQLGQILIWKRRTYYQSFIDLQARPVYIFPINPHTKKKWWVIKDIMAAKAVGSVRWSAPDFVDFLSPCFLSSSFFSVVVPSVAAIVAP